jgi:hypothetical protein
LHSRAGSGFVPVKQAEANRLERQRRYALVHGVVRRREPPWILSWLFPSTDADDED